jgi:hypothetical protein
VRDFVRRTGRVDVLRDRLGGERLARGIVKAVSDEGVEQIFTDVAGPERSVAVERDRPTRVASARLVDREDDFVDFGAAHEAD